MCKARVAFISPLNGRGYLMKQLLEQAFMAMGNCCAGKGKEGPSADQPALGSWIAGTTPAHLGMPRPVLSPPPC